MYNYEAVPKRLLAFRKKLGITQKDMSKMLNITQSHYSKIEHGKCYISYKILKKLDDFGCNMDYLITGRVLFRKSGALKDLYITYDNDKCKIEEIFYWSIKKMGFVNKSADTAFGCEFLKICTADEKKEDNPIEIIRKIYGISQIKMANELGINVRRFRRIEKGFLMPDSLIFFYL